MDIPASSPEGKDWIYRTLVKLKNHDLNRIIDIGCGAATYYNYYHSLLGGSWTGIEIWEPYIEEYNLNSFYDNIIISDAAEVDYESLGQFDVAFVGDVLEHMSKESALKVIEGLQKICRFIFISIPIVYYPSEEYDHNPYLRHIKPDWSDKEVSESFSNIVDRSLEKTVGTYLITKEDLSIKPKEFFFITGLPRSGSTLLGALLRQNNAYVTATSPMLDQLVTNHDIYKYKLQTTKANYIQEQLNNITFRLIQGLWAHVKEDVIIDSNRGWSKNLPTVELLFGKKIKCIVVYRDIPSIMASWLTLLRKNPNNYLDNDLRRRGMVVDDKNRMYIMWEEMVKDCVEGFICSIKDGKDNIILVNYDLLCTRPQEELSKINSFLGLPQLNYDIENVSINAIDQADEKAWGLVGMHTIRSKVQKLSNNPRELLGEELFEYFSKIDTECWKIIENINKLESNNNLNYENRII